jgi:hypothetical protein
VSLDRVAARDPALDDDVALRTLLGDAGEDPAMHDVQDPFFDHISWVPAVQAASGLGIAMALGSGVVYDSQVHGKWGAMRGWTIARHGAVAGMGEEARTSVELAERRDGLATQPITLLQRIGHVGRDVGAGRGDGRTGRSASGAWQIVETLLPRRLLKKVQVQGGARSAE